MIKYRKIIIGFILIIFAFFLFTGCCTNQIYPTLLSTKLNNKIDLDHCKVKLGEALIYHIDLIGNQHNVIIINGNNLDYLQDVYFSGKPNITIKESLDAVLNQVGFEVITQGESIIFKEKGKPIPSLKDQIKERSVRPPCSVPAQPPGVPAQAPGR